MKALIRDVGINSDTIEFYNLARLREVDGNRPFESDRQLPWLVDGLYSPINMTDYEENFVGWNEFPKDVPLNNISLLDVRRPEAWPQTNKLTQIEPLESRPLQGTGATHFGLVKANAADPEDEDDIAYGQEDEEEDYDEEGEGDDYGEEDYGDYDEEEGDDEPEWSAEDKPRPRHPQNRYFERNEKLHQRFNEVELDSFMKLLNVNPTPQWQDRALYHYKLGIHRYEDDNQEHDSDFHLLGEVEREHNERYEVEKFRKGSEVKFAVGDKVPFHKQKRF